MRRAPRTTKAYQRGGVSPTGGFDPTLNDGDPTDPVPKSRGLSRLQPLEPPRASGMRRDRPAAKSAKGRATSRRR
jgi:hypothetical protein